MHKHRNGLSDEKEGAKKVREQGIGAGNTLAPAQGKCGKEAGQNRERQRTAKQRHAEEEKKRSTERVWRGQKTGAEAKRGARGAKRAKRKT